MMRRSLVVIPRAVFYYVYSLCYFATNNTIFSNIATCIRVLGDIFAAKKIMSKQINQMAVKYRSLVGGVDEGVKGERSLDKIFSPGCYFVEITHVDDSVGLPVEFCGEEHYIVGNLVVTDSGTQGPKQNNRMTGQVLIFTGRKTGDTKICLRTYVGGAWGKWSELSKAGSRNEIGSTDELVAAVEALIEDVDALKGVGEGSISAMVSSALETVSERINLNAQKITDIMAGNAVAAVAYDVYSLQGKSDKCSFAKRTVAGRSSVHGGVASLKQLGGNIVKNLIDGTFARGWQTINSGDNMTLVDDYVVVDANCADAGITCSITPYAKHIYYCKALVYNVSGSSYMSLGSMEVSSQGSNVWEFLSCRGTLEDGTMMLASIDDAAEFIVVAPMLIDLTELYYSGFEPTKEECDAMFAHSSAFKKGLAMADSSEFRTAGYNQCDESKALANRTISGGVIIDGANFVIPMPCVPCKAGVGENNGYVVSTGVGDLWSEEAIKAVYYTPFNPSEKEGELYLEQLQPQPCSHCNGSHSVYIPSSAGYLLIETTTLKNICAHLAWSGDVDFKHYEEYKETKINLPKLDVMSAWGLAGISGWDGYIKDSIDFDNRKYIKRVGRINLKDYSFNKYSAAFINWYAWKNEDAVVYTNYTNKELVNKVSQSAAVDVKDGPGMLCNKLGTVNAIETDEHSATTVLSITMGDVVYLRDSSNDAFYNWYSIVNGVDMYSPPFLYSQMSYLHSAVFSKDINGFRAMYSPGYNNCVALNNNSKEYASKVLFIRRDECTTANEFKAYIESLSDEDAMLYYVLPEPEVYDIPDDVLSTFVASDYGTEEFVGTAAPLRDNIIFYMRTLANELRNLLDRLYSKLKVTDPVQVADKLAAAI